MKILGLSHPISLNGAACLIDDKKIIAFAEEERFNRIKHSTYYPPKKSIEYCLQEAGCSLKDVDYIALGFDTFGNIIKSNFYDELKAVYWKANLSQKESALSKIIFYLTSYYHGLVRLPFNYKDKKVKFIRHHLAHAASTYFVSSFDKACIISLDGSGGQEAGILAIGENNRIRILKRVPPSQSLGGLYETITQILGFEGHDGEGKVMGLSAFYKNPPKRFSFVNFKDGEVFIDHKKMYNYLSKIRLKVKKNQLSETNIFLAASVQKTLEDAYLNMGEWLYKTTGVKNFCLAGGVALNCLANTKLLNSPFVEKIFIQPAAHDAGTALGAALLAYQDVTGTLPNIKFDHVYLGPKFSDADIKKTLDKGMIKKYKKYKDIEKVTAKLLSTGKIVGWFQGRMEVGPRALGNRSILANPKLPWIKDAINERVKGREPWRPFAPSILEECAKDYLVDVDSSPFMILESRVKKEKIKDLISATHIDGTVRPQTVSKKTNLKYWQLINEFYKITGIPVLLNTSFNLAGEPIVCTPEDALATFYRCGMDYLVLGDYLISKD